VKPPGEEPDLTRLVLALPDEGAVSALLACIRECLRRAVNRKRIRQPSYIGLDQRSWDGLAFEAAAHEFLVEQFWPKRGPVTVQAKAGGIGQAYLARMVDRWLVDRQRARDPLGSANFKALRRAVEAACAAGDLAAEAVQRIDKRTVLRLAGCAPAGELWTADQIAGSAVLLENWPRLRERLRSRGEDPPPEFRDLLARLRADGCAGFVFQDLLDALHRLAGVGALRELPDGGEVAAPAADPAADSDAFATAVRSLRAAIDRAGIPESRRDLLHAMVEAYVDEVRGGPPLSLTEFAARYGLGGRQRAHELKKQLQELASMVFAASKRGCADGQR
jgi:hypothetical protein